jgi:hypothetical protein
VAIYTKLRCRSIFRYDIILPKDIQRHSIGKWLFAIEAENGHIAVVSEITHRNNLLGEVKTNTNVTCAVVEHIHLVLGKRLPVEMLVDKDSLPLAISELLTQEVEVGVALL